MDSGVEFRLIRIRGIHFNEQEDSFLGRYACSLIMHVLGSIPSGPVRSFNTINLSELFLNPLDV